jgi:hypothetical protein
MKSNLKLLTLMLAVCLTAAVGQPAPARQADDPNPPEQVVRLVFIHHSTGENWLADGYGDLGRTLGENNYFVSDTNYGWGPNAVGDRTDIPDWMEWFRSGDTPAYMEALFGESGQNSTYKRRLSDPGGENQIIMFKSCFPNSDLEGNPNDPPGSYADMTVSGAKYVYNQVLAYFASQPDKLFIVITSPPLSDATHAANARAFTGWLVNDWLRENNYQLNNVAVFDFYNVLTGPEAHHRFRDGRFEHTVGSRNTLYYPSDDDHPSIQGSLKATEEFVPLLNVFYHRWQADTSPASLPEPVEPGEDAPQPELYPAQPQAVGLIDDFETDNPAGTNGWEPFWDEATTTSMHCASEAGMAPEGGRALTLDFDVSPGAWATCALFYEGAQDWSSTEGLGFDLHAAQPGLVFNLDVYAGSPDAQETYNYTIEAPPESADGWIPIVIQWPELHRADWEENAGTPFTSSDRILGLAFGFETYADAPNTGTLWVDQLTLLGAQQVEAAAFPGEGLDDGGEDVEVPSQQTFRRFLPCGGATLVPLGLVGLAGLLKKRLRGG